MSAMEGAVESLKGLREDVGRDTGEIMQEKEREGDVQMAMDGAVEVEDVDEEGATGRKRKREDTKPEGLC
jgi:hypothetical protein